MPARNFFGVWETPDFIYGSPPVYPARTGGKVFWPRNAAISAAARDAIGVSLGNQPVPDGVVAGGAVECGAADRAIWSPPAENKVPFALFGLLEYRERRMPSHLAGESLHGVQHRL